MIDDNFFSYMEDRRIEGPLTEFIGDKIRSYVAHGRKGVPRGDLIEFSEAKHTAALLSLTSIERKIQAQMSGVSYDLLLKWRSEHRFLDEMNRYATAFATIIYKSFADTVETYGSQMTPATSHQYQSELFGDLEEWGFVTREHVVQRVLNGAKNNPERLLFPAIGCIDIIRKDSRYKMRLERRYVLYLIEDTINFLSRPKMSEEGRRSELTALTAVKRWLGEG